MTTQIERLGMQGDGIAKGPIFAARTLPGEVIEGDIEGQRIADPKIVEPSPNRVRPPCRHYKSCGGCALQHASDSFVADWKVDVVRAALSAHGIIAEFRPIITSPAKTRRRATFSVRRSKTGALVGFHGRASDVLVEVPECILLVPGLLDTIPALKLLAIAGGSRRSEMKATVTATSGGADVLMVGGKPLDGPLRAELAQIAVAQNLARLTWDEEQVMQRSAPAVSMGRAQVVPPPGAFLQATLNGQQALVRSVQETVGKANKVVDLFAGSGTFALPLSEHAEVHAVESEGAMLAALDKGWRQATGLKRITTETRDLFRRPLLADELKPFDCAVIDPPRAGAEAQMRALAASNVKKIAAVSCNPVTFGRDAAILVESGFTLDWVQVVDQFRWSPHVEASAQFTRP